MIKSTFFCYLQIELYFEECSNKPHTQTSNSDPELDQDSDPESDTDLEEDDPENGAGSYRAVLAPSQSSCSFTKLYIAPLL